MCHWLRDITLSSNVSDALLQGHLTKAIHELISDLHNATVLVQEVRRGKIASLLCGSFPNTLHIHQMLRVYFVSLIPKLVILTLSVHYEPLNNN